MIFVLYDIRSFKLNVTCSVNCGEVLLIEEQLLLNIYRTVLQLIYFVDCL